MRKLLYLGAVALVMLSLSVRPARAITGGVVDDQNTYSNVGAILVVHAPNPDYPVPNIVGSGTLIHPRVLLTAGHVTAYFQSFWDRGIGSPAGTPWVSSGAGLETARQ